MRLREGVPKLGKVVYQLLWIKIIWESQYTEDPTLYSLESRNYISILAPEERDILITRYRELRAKEAV